MRCSEFEDRLYDEDCRQSLVGRGSVPPDIQAHMERCAVCRASWAAAAVDTRGLARVLLIPPPARLRAALHAARPERVSAGQWMDWSVATWILAGGALGASSPAVLPGCPPVWQWTGFCVGASLALAFAVTPPLRVGWLLSRLTRLSLRSLGF